MSQPKDLPQSSDLEFWGEDGVRVIAKPIPLSLCDTHTRDNWMEGKNYQEKDGVVICTRCGWGFRKPGYLRVKNGEIVDLRILTGLSTQ